jgi:hypothetical protein
MKSMKRPRVRLSRPLYEGLPWLYMGSGLVALTYSYFTPLRLLSLVMGLAGLVGLLGGLVVVLRRRDFRALRANYTDPDALTDDKKD